MTQIKKYKVLYLTCLENTQNNDIHQSQIMGLRGKGVDYTFLFLSPRFILGKAGFSINKNRYHEKDVKEVKIPLFSANLVMYLFLIPYFLLIASPVLIYYIHKENAQIVHCRNLLSSLLAVFCKVCLLQKIVVVCDPRSVYVEEGVIIGRFKYNGITYKGWKIIERWIYRNSDYCLGLSENFTDYLMQSNEHSLFIPAIVRPSFVFDIKKRQELRDKMGLTNNQYVCIYVGSIGQWHSVDALIKSLKIFRDSIQGKDEMKVVFLSGNKTACKEISNSFSADEVLKCGRVSPEEVYEYLLVADWGIVPGSDHSGYCYDLLYETMLSSKAEEFLSVGLPIIVSDRIVSLANLLNKYNAGVVINNGIIDAVNSEFDRDTISKVFHDMFNADVVVSQYSELYENLI